MATGPSGLTLRIGDHGRTRTPTRRFRKPRLCPVELHGHGERTRTRTSIAGLEDRSLSRWQMRPCLEMQARIELARGGFADRSVPTSPLHRIGTGGRDRTCSLPGQSRTHRRLCYSRIGQGGWSRSSGLSVPSAALCLLSCTLVALAGRPLVSCSLPTPAGYGPKPRPL
jgi:hypothetical protein